MCFIHLAVTVLTPQDSRDGTQYETSHTGDLGAGTQPFHIWVTTTTNLLLDSGSGGVSSHQSSGEHFLSTPGSGGAHVSIKPQTPDFSETRGFVILFFRALLLVLWFATPLGASPTQKPAPSCHPLLISVDSSTASRMLPVPAVPRCTSKVIHPVSPLPSHSFC